MPDEQFLFNLSTLKMVSITLQLNILLLITGGVVESV